MTLITSTEELDAFCARQAGQPYITVDTEFLREKTYWPLLCLVQIAGISEEAAIDALAPEIDLTPLFALMQNADVLKVFHAGRQDLEIFFHLSGAVPHPIFDTQVAAMVCGFGDAVSYETLSGKLAGAQLDKSARYTDWSHRPLTERQLSYAIADVTHLRVVYESLSAELDKTSRQSWLEGEMAILMDPATYHVDPDEAWRRLKTRGGNRKFFAVLQAVARWREQAAQDRDVPRGRMIKDESLLEVAAHPPRTIEELAQIRGFGRGAAEGKLGPDILAAVERGLATPPSEAPHPPARNDAPPGLGPLVELLRVLLKLRCEEHGVAQKLVASAADLELIASDDTAGVPALNGWRHDIFGRDAIALKHRKLALTAQGKRIEIVRLDD